MSRIGEYNDKLLEDVITQDYDHYTVAGFDYADTLIKLAKQLSVIHDRSVLQISKSNPHDFEGKLSIFNVIVVRGRVLNFTFDESKSAILTEYNCPYLDGFYVPWKTNIRINSPKTYMALVDVDKLMLPVFYVRDNRSDRSTESDMVTLDTIPIYYSNVCDISSEATIVGLDERLVAHVRNIIDERGYPIEENKRGPVGAFVVRKKNIQTALGMILKLFSLNRNLKLVVY